ncbi:MAG: glycosyltransferase, partial [Terriglobales bacterium]
MKIAFDIRRVRSFGIGTYIRNVVRTLARLDRGHRYVLIGSPESFHEMGPLPQSFELESFPHPESSARNVFEFHQIVSRYRCDVVHVPHLFWRPRYVSCPYVVTVHDLLTFLQPRQEGSPLRRMVQDYLTRRVLHHAARICAVSDFTKHDVMRVFGVPESRIEVTYNAIDERFR